MKENNNKDVLGKLLKEHSRPLPAASAHEADQIWAKIQKSQKGPLGFGVWWKPSFLMAGLASAALAIFITTSLRDAEQSPPFSEEDYVMELYDEGESDLQLLEEDLLAVL